MSNDKSASRGSTSSRTSGNRASASGRSANSGSSRRGTGSTRSSNTNRSAYTGGRSGRDNRYSNKTSRIGLKALLIVLLAVLVLVGGGIAVLTLTDVATIKSITIRGTERFTSEEIAERAGISEGATFFTVNPRQIEKRLEEDPWIQDATVHRSFSSLSVTVEETEISCVVEVQSSSMAIQSARWLISPDGVWLSKVSEDLVDEINTAEEKIAKLEEEEAKKAAEEEKAAEASGASGDLEVSDQSTEDTAAAEAAAAEAAAEEAAAAEAAAAAEGTADASTTTEKAEDIVVPTSVCTDVEVSKEELDSLISVTGIPRGLEAEANTRTGNETLLGILDILNELSQEHKEQVSGVTGETVESITLILKSNVTVVFGTATDIKAKEILVDEFLTEYEGKVSYINVSSTSHPTCRALE